MTPWTVVCQTPLSTISQGLLKFKCIESVMLSNHFILCHSLLFLPSVLPSNKVFSSESPLHIKWQKYCSLCSSNNLSSEYWGLVSFKINWFDLLAVQSPSPQFENISSLALSLIYGPTVTSVHDYRKSNSFDSRDLSRQDDVSVF